MTEKPTDLYGTIEIDTAKQASKPSPKPVRSSGRKKKPERKNRKSGSRAFFWIGLLGLLLIIYSAAGYLLVPYLLRTVLPRSLKENASLILTTEQVRFNPFNFSLDVRNVSLETSEDEESAERLLTVDRLRVDLDVLSLLRGDLVCSSMDVGGVDLRIIRNQDKTYNISFLLGGRSLQDHSDIIDFAELPFLFSLNNIKISDSRIIIYDRITQKDHLIENIELALPVISNFDFQNESYIHPRFSAVVNGSPISLTGEAVFGANGMGGKQTQLSCDLNDIDIPLYFDYLPVALPVDITRGKANGKLQLTFSPEQEKGSKISIQFSLNTTGLDVESRDSKLKLSIPSANLEGTLEPFSNSITFQNVLLREPSVISDGNITRDTLASLIPLTLRPGPEDRLHQVIPSLRIKLLIADGGSFRIENKDKKKRQGWKAIQLSIKNFSNELLKDEGEERSFRLSGEQSRSGAFFTWQGTFDKRNHPGGNLQLNNIAASVVAPFLGRKASDISGTAEIQGLLNILLSDKKESPFDYSLKSTRVTVKELRLKDQGVVWLRTPVLRCEPVSRINGITDLGNVFLPNSTAVINQAKLPFLFERFSSQSSLHILHGIDFSGSLKIVTSKSKKPLLDLKNVTFQANKLEQQQIQKDNFVFSAQLKETEDIQAKGSFHIAPVQISTQISAANLDPNQLFTWFSDSKTLLTSKSVLSVKGAFRYPELEFTGELEALNMRIGDPVKPVLRAGKMILSDFSWSETSEKLHIKELSIDQPEFTWLMMKQAQNPLVLTSIFLRHMFLPEPDSTASDPDIALSGFTLSIDQLGITDGAISYRDARLQPPLALGLTGINGTLLNIAYPVAKEDSSVSLKGNIEGQPFSLEAQGNLIQSPPFAQVNFTSPGIPLRLFSQQIDQKIKGIDFSQGSAAVTYNGSWKGQDRSSTAALVLTGLRPEKPGSAAGTSLGVLMGDTGSISKEFKSGSRQQFRSVFSEALDHYARLMIKGSLDPMLVSSTDFKDLVEKQFISFIPGTAQVTGESIERLSRYNEFLAIHPLINLRIAGFSDQKTDSPALKSELTGIEQKRVDDENLRRKQLWQKEKAAAEKAAMNNNKPQGSAILETDLSTGDSFVPISPREVFVSKKMLTDLASRREQAVISYLVQQLSLSPDRLSPAPPRTVRIKNGGDFARALITLTDGFSSDAVLKTNKVFLPNALVHHY